MKLPDLHVESVADGCWLSWKDLGDLIPHMAANYHKRLTRFFVGDERDLEQAAQLAMLEYAAANGEPERVREMAANGIPLLHRAMVAEIRQNRRQVDEDFDWDSLEQPQTQRPDKQLEMLEVWVNVVAKVANKSDGHPNYLMALLHYGCGWTLEEIRDLFRRKKCHRRAYPIETIKKWIATAVRRLRKKAAYLKPYSDDLRLIQFLK